MILKVEESESLIHFSKLRVWNLFWQITRINSDTSDLRVSVQALQEIIMFANRASLTEKLSFKVYATRIG